MTNLLYKNYQKWRGAHKFYFLELIVKNKIIWFYPRISVIIADWPELIKSNFGFITFFGALNKLVEHIKIHINNVKKK